MLSCSSLFILPEAPDAVTEQAADTAAADVAETVEGQLEKHAPVGFFLQQEKFVFIDPLPGDQADRGAAVAVFDPGKGVEVPAVAVIIIPSTQQAPTIVQGPDAGNVGLLDAGVDAAGRLAVQIHQQAVAIADIEDVVVVGMVAERHAAFVDTLPLLIPLDIREQLPAVI